MVYGQSKFYKNGMFVTLIVGWDDVKEAWLCKNIWSKLKKEANIDTFWIAYKGYANNLYFNLVSKSRKFNGY